MIPCVHLKSFPAFETNTFKKDRLGKKPKHENRQKSEWKEIFFNIVSFSTSAVESDVLSLIEDVHRHFKEM